MVRAAWGDFAAVLREVWLLDDSGLGLLYTLATNPTFPLWSGDGRREGCLQLTAPNTSEVLTPGTYARRSSSRVWQNKVCAWGNYG